MIKTIFSVRSENRRWGVDIVGPAQLAKLSRPMMFRGTLRPLGKVAGIETFAAEISETAETWVLAVTGPSAGIGGEIEPVWGARKIHQTALQGGRYATLLEVGPGAVVTAWGYMRRSRELWLLWQGRKVPAWESLDAATLAYHGLLEPADNNLEKLSALMAEVEK